MHRLTVLKHDVVRDIDDVVDGAHAGRAQAAAKPDGGGSDLHVFHHRRAVSKAQIGRLHADRDIIGNIASGGFILRLGELKLLIEGDRAFAGKSDDAEAVGAVGGYLEFDHGIVKVERFDRIVAGLGHGVDVTVGDYQYSVLDCAGHIVEGEPQLGDGAEHSLGGDAAELAGFDLHSAGQAASVGGDGDERALGDVGCACDDLERRIRSHVDFADDEAVGVWMGGNLKHPSDDHAGDIGADFFISLDLGAGFGHPVAVFLHRERGHVRVIGEPFH